MPFETVHATESASFTADGQRRPISSELKLEMLRRMLRIRRFEETVTALHAAGDIAGSLHTSIGQEAEIVGACMALDRHDYMVGNHRSHGHPIAKGAALVPLAAELFGRSTGICKGKGGSMHLSDFSVGSLGETSIVGSGLPVATGAALGATLLGNGRISLCFFGDGAANEGTFHESLNLAAIWRLPVIFLCENNGYAVSTRADHAAAISDIARRGDSYGIPWRILDGQDVEHIYGAVLDAVGHARAGRGPTLLEAKTHRFDDHSVNLRRLTVDRGAELEAARQRDPIALYIEVLRRSGIGEELLSAVDAEVRAEVEASIDAARGAPLPGMSDAFTDVFIEPLALPPYLSQAGEHHGRTNG
jgi:pyruvate dehydrogenase E1 component alpha subunit